MLIDMICSAKFDREVMYQLICKFSPILKKYSFKLHMEDAYESMLLAFIESIHRIDPKNFRCCNDGAVVKYLERVVKNNYVGLLKRKLKESDLIVSLDDMPGADRFVKSPQVQDRLQDYIPSDVYHKILTKREQRVLFLIFSDGLSAAEIARVCGISRQSVNQTKHSALRKLKKYCDS